MMSQLLLLIGAHDNVVGMFALAGGFLIAIIAMAFGYFKTRQREQTRREIAAYVAEGSMTSEEGERLLKAGKE